MNLHDLQVFVTAYNQRSINKAAAALGYAQSNLTARIKSLEAEFNTSFFYRSSRGITPTADGDKMYAYATMVLTKTDDLKRSLGTTQKKRVLTSEILFNYLVLYTEQYPFEHSQFDIKTTTEIVDDHQLDYDIIFTYFKFNNRNYSILDQGFIDSQFMQSRSSFHNINHERKLPILINSDRSCPFRLKTLEIISDRKKVEEVNSLDTIIQLVEKNKGVALLPGYLKKQKDIYSIDPNVYPIQFYMLALNR